MNTAERARLVRVGEVCAVLNLRRASRSVTAFYDEVLRPTRLRATQLALLVAIAAAEAAPISRLAVFLLTDRTTLTRNLRPLAAGGLARVTVGSDARELVVRVTSRGLRAVRRALPYWERAQRAAIKGLGERRWRRLLADLEKVYMHVP